MPGGDEFCTRSPHLEDVEVFKSQNRKPNIPIAADDKLTVLAPSTSLALVSLREPQDLMLQVCLPSSRNLLRQC
jgi:hypothetical protein